MELSERYIKWQNRLYCARYYGGSIITAAECNEMQHDFERVGRLDGSLGHMMWRVIDKSYLWPDSYNHYAVNQQFSHMHDGGCMIADSLYDLARRLLPYSGLVTESKEISFYRNRIEIEMTHTQAVLSRRGLPQRKLFVCYPVYP